ncbi:inorganic phosphate transporter [bacterium]|nr:inorganic phosphate transporter [bacterium]
MYFAAALVFALAYANGANDVSKGIATLIAGGVTDYRRAIAWGAAWTGIGGWLGAMFASAMVATFGNGLLAAGTEPSLAAAHAALAGAAGWVFLATRAGFPVSTTHAIVGAVIGATTAAGGLQAIPWTVLGEKVFLPLFVTPILAGALTVALLTRRRRVSRGSSARDCVCVEIENRAAAMAGGALTMGVSPRVLLVAGHAATCERDHPAAWAFAVDRLHWLTSAATSLARGMNDAPKIVALFLAVSAFSATGGPGRGAMFAIVTAAMVGGSVLSGRRVTRHLAENVTEMDHHDGFAANLVAAGLVTVGAVYGLPMSTTHVASGGIFGAGALRGSLQRRAVRNIFAAWLVTLPVAAVFGALVYALIASLSA